MTKAEWLGLIGLLFGTGGFGTSVFFWRQRRAQVRKINADAHGTEIIAIKGEAEIRRIDTETDKLYREEFYDTVKEFREERRQMSMERAAERDQHKIELASEREQHRLELAAERAANSEVIRKKEVQFRAELDRAAQSNATLEAKLIEFQEALNRCAEESHKSTQQVGTIKSQLGAVKLQLDLLAPLVSQIGLMEAAIARIETGGNGSPSKDLVPQSE